MRPVRVTVGSQTASASIPLDTYQNPFNVSLGVSLSNGASLVYTVQHTFDDVHSGTFNPSTAVWYDNATLSGKSATLDGNYSFPVTAVRLNVSSYTSGSATLTVTQAGMPGR